MEAVFGLVNTNWLKKKTNGAQRKSLFQPRKWKPTVQPGFLYESLSMKGKTVDGDQQGRRTAKRSMKQSDSSGGSTSTNRYRLLILSLTRSARSTGKRVQAGLELLQHAESGWQRSRRKYPCPATGWRLLCGVYPNRAPIENCLLACLSK